MSATEAAELLAALPAEQRPVWATALYGGLRLGELLALRWEDVHLAGGAIRVWRSWDTKVGQIEPKSRKGTRTVPLVPTLRDVLAEHKVATRRDGTDFSTTSTRSVSLTSVATFVNNDSSSSRRTTADLHPCSSESSHRAARLRARG